MGEPGRAQNDFLDAVLMDTLFIFGAKYLFFLSIALSILVLYKTDQGTRRKIITLALLSLPLAFLLSLLARELYFNPRPFVVDEYTPLIEHEPDNGFPSDHTLLVSSIAGLFLFFHRRVSLYLWFIAIIVAISRVYVGVHHWLDVIASIIIALFSVFIVYTILSLRKKI